MSANDSRRYAICTSRQVLAGAAGLAGVTVAAPLLHVSGGDASPARRM